MRFPKELTQVITSSLATFQDHSSPTQIWKISLVCPIIGKSTHSKLPPPSSLGFSTFLSNDKLCIFLDICVICSVYRCLVKTGAQTDSQNRTFSDRQFASAKLVSQKSDKIDVVLLNFHCGLKQIFHPLYNEKKGRGERILWG